MFDRADILRSAWNAYRLARPAFSYPGDTATKRKFLRDLFVKFLRRAWAEAKKAAPLAKQFLDAQHRVQAEKVAAMAPAARSARISAIRDELTVLDYAPLGVRAVQRRHDLGAELSLLRSASL